MSFYMKRHVEREILSALIDGELSASERRLVHEHLQACDECRETVDEFTHIHGMVESLPRIVAPESFVSDVLVRPRAPIHRVAYDSLTRGRRRWVTLGLVGAAVATTLAGLVTPPPTDPVPMDVIIDRHATIHSGVEPGANVVFTVNGR